MKYYCIIYKPYNVLSQFSATEGKQTLKDFFDVPTDVYPVGRLDYDSEGLLLLTNDTTINHRLLDPRFNHSRTYWVQVDGAITTDALQQLERGMAINVEGRLYHTKKCKAQLLHTTSGIPDRDPPIRVRKHIPAPWIQLQLTEGKNRQVRKMTAAAGFPTLRLIRYSIEHCTIDGLEPGALRILTKQEIDQLIFHGRNDSHKLKL